MKKIILLILCSVLALPASSALAGKYDIKEMTPPVKKALESRRERYDKLEFLKTDGVIGENNSGYVEVLKSGQGAESAVNAENADRKTIYKAIVEQNNLGSGALSAVEKVFAEVQRNKAGAGDKIQKEDGSWTTK